MSTTTLDRFGYDSTAADPVPTPEPGGSALFPAAPIYARTQQRKKSNLPLLIGVPLAIVAAGALVWATSPKTDSGLLTEPPAQVAQTPTTPVAPAAATPAPMPTPAPAQVARAETAAPAPATRATTAPAR
ncbi:MAG: hypothetical protein JWP92_1168, partial [Caulobacter sp.]|nr:hypothetical protein [Caulobacter sp.]